MTLEDSNTDEHLDCSFQYDHEYVSIEMILGAHRATTNREIKN